MPLRARGRDFCVGWSVIEWGAANAYRPTISSLANSNWQLTTAKKLKTVNGAMVQTFPEFFFATFAPLR